MAKKKKSLLGFYAGPVNRPNLVMGVEVSVDEPGVLGKFLRASVMDGVSREIGRTLSSVRHEIRGILGLESVMGKEPL